MWLMCFDPSRVIPNNKHINTLLLFVLQMDCKTKHYTWILENWFSKILSLEMYINYLDNLYYGINYLKGLNS